MTPLFPQLLLDVHGELIVDLFAGGGGASLGIEMATGRPPDVAVNHDAAAVALHQANHPQTHHVCSDVFEVDPRRVTGGRKVGLLWASPDCTFHSKARGAKPFRSKETKRRALAWVVTRWAGQVRPRVIMLENVEEFAWWGPLVGPPDAQRPDPRRRGRTFRAWVRSLVRLGYEVEHRELRACDYGAPTIRKRLFLIARCDGQPIVWPEPTHGPKRARPYRTAAECIDWSVPMLSIFATREEARAWGRERGVPTPVRPLAEATMRRIARGVKRFVLDNPKPFIVPVKTWGGGGNDPRPLDEAMRTVTASKRGEQALVAPLLAHLTHQGPERAHAADAPAPTITGAQRGELGLVSPFLVPRYGERAGQEPRVRSVEEPAPVIVPTGNGGSLVAAHLEALYSGGDRAQASDDPLRTVTGTPRHAVVSAFLAKHFGGVVGVPIDQPAPTVTTIDHNSLVAAHLSTFYGDHAGARDGAGRGAELEEPLRTQGTENRHALVAAHIQRDFGTSVGHAADVPLGTIVGDRGHAALVAAFLSKYYGVGVGQEVDQPAPTATTKDRSALVTVTIAGEPYVVADIAMRMLQPRELYNAQGFHPGYIIDRGADGRRLTKTEQVRMVGNSVSPPQAAALVRSNVPELIARDEVAA